MGTTQDLEDTVYSPCIKCGSQKNHWLFTALTWCLIDVCGSSAILLAVRLARTTIEPLQRVSDRPTGRDHAAGRPSHTWLRAIEADLGPLNFGLATAWRNATTRDEWRHCGHSNVPAEYSLKEENSASQSGSGIRTMIRMGLGSPDICQYATFHPNPCTRFLVILLTDRHTGRQTNKHGQKHLPPLSEVNK